MAWSWYRTAGVAVAAALALALAMYWWSTPAPSAIPSTIASEVLPDARWELIEERQFAGGLRSMLPSPMRGSADDVHGEWLWRVDVDRDEFTAAITAWLLSDDAPEIVEPGLVEPTVGLEGRTWSGYIGQGGASHLAGELGRSRSTNRVLITWQRDHSGPGHSEVTVRSLTRGHAGATMCDTLSKLSRASSR